MLHEKIDTSLFAEDKMQSNEKGFSEANDFWSFPNEQQQKVFRAIVWAILGMDIVYKDRRSFSANQAKQSNFYIPEYVP